VVEVKAVLWIACSNKNLKQQTKINVFVKTSGFPVFIKV
jgi:hypothetical protein